MQEDKITEDHKGQQCCFVLPLWPPARETRRGRDALDRIAYGLGARGLGGGVRPRHDGFLLQDLFLTATLQLSIKKHQLPTLENIRFVNQKICILK